MGVPVVPPKPARDPAAVRQSVIRMIAVLGIVGGVAMALIGTTPGIAGGWGKLVLTVPGMIIVAGSFAAFVETTPWARSKRRRE